MDSKAKAIIATVVLVAVVIVGVLVFMLKSQNDATQQQLEAYQIEAEQARLEAQYEELNNGIQKIDDNVQYIQNDSILQKYQEAKDRIEQLTKELKNNKITSAKRIKELQDEISTLKDLIRHYLEIIDQLKKENEELKAENESFRSQNEQLHTRVTETTAKNENLSKRMELAEKLNVTGVSLTALKKNGKEEKNVTKAKQLRVMFTIPQNNSTPVGEKTLYVRITSPEGSLLGRSGTFNFEGGNVPYTERKTVEYAGQEIAGITLYYNVDTALSPGDYKVEIFADDYRLISRSFTLNK